MPLDVEESIVAARRERPRWGARKLRAWLTDRHPGRVWPSASCIAAILKRRGLAVPRRRRRRVVPLTQPFAACDRPNAVWCVDFKGWFRTSDGNKCYSLTLIDAYSRYLLRCEAVDDPNGYRVQRIFDSAFREFGLPKAIRSDSGQQRAFDLYRVDYNEQRPHEALGQKPPATAYERSRRSYPRPLERVESPPWCHDAPVDKHGSIRWRGRRVHISHALALETAALSPRPRPAATTPTSWHRRKCLAR